MKNKELFNRTIEILVKAYLNDDLRHSDCSACAVGNIVAANMGYKPNFNGMSFSDNDGNHISADWFDIFHFGTLRFDLKSDLTMPQIYSTGYTAEQLMEIERAFESYSYVRDQYKSLMAVCDCLMEIHEASKEEIKEAKALFTV